MQDCWWTVAAAWAVSAVSLRSTINSQLRTGTDSGNPTV